MSFKDIVLPDVVIADLYGSMIVQDSDAAASAPLARSGNSNVSRITDAVSEVEVIQKKKIIDSGDPAATISKNDPLPKEITPLPAPEQTILAKDELRATVHTSTGPYRFLGKNQRNVSVIARYTHDPYIPEQDLEFLTKLLSACKLNLGDVAIINDSVQAVKFQKLNEELAPKYVLMFGLEPSELGLPLSFPQLKPQSFSNCNFLFIPPIGELLPDNPEVRETKKKLWESLKKMFLS